MTAKITLSYVDGSDVVSGTITVTGADTHVEESLTVPNNADHTFEVGINKDALKSLVLKASHAMTITFKDSVPASVGSLDLVAGIPYIYSNQMDQTLNPNPLSADCVTLHTNSNASATLEVRADYAA